MCRNLSGRSSAREVLLDKRWQQTALHGWIMGERKLSKKQPVLVGVKCDQRKRQMLYFGICVVLSPKKPLRNAPCRSTSWRKGVVETTFDFLLKSILFFVCGKQLGHFFRSCKGFSFIARKLGSVGYIKEFFFLPVLAIDIALWLWSRVSTESNSIISIFISTHNSQGIVRSFDLELEPGDPPQPKGILYIWSL